MESQLNILSELYRALGDPVRLQLLALLTIRPACVCELVEWVPVGQSAVSQHLRRLRDAGLVTEQRQRQWVVYRLRDALPAHVQMALAGIPLPADAVRALTERPLVSACAVSRRSAGAPSAAVRSEL